jgi:hypothetical protein
MSKGVINDLTDKRTKRLNTKLIIIAAYEFFLIYLLDFDFEITFSNDVSPNDLIFFFIIYYTLEIVKQIV